MALPGQEVARADDRPHHFRELWNALVAQHAIDAIHVANKLRREGRATIAEGRLVPSGSRADDARHFALELRSQAAGDATLLRCRSEVGHLDLNDDATLDRLYDLQIELQHPRICVEPAATSHDDVVAVQHDILFSPTATQLQDVVSLVERTVVSAAGICAELVTPPASGARSRPVGRRRRE